MIPIDPRAFTSLAHQVRGSLALGTHTIGVRWRSIGGSYYTLGQTSLQRDRSGLRVQDTFRMLSNTLAVTLGWESYHDNLDDNKPTTTANNGLTLDLSWQQDADRPGFSVGYRGYGRSNDETTLASGGLDENTTTYSFGTFVPIRALQGFNTRINLNYVNVGRDDTINPLTGTNNTYYLVGVTARMQDRATEFGLTYGLNSTELTGYGAETTFHRVQARARHGLTSRILGMADATLTSAVTPDDTNPFGLSYTRTDLSAGAEYYWTQSFYASLRAGLSTYRDQIREGIDTNEFSLLLRLVRSF